MFIMLTFFCFTSLVSVTGFYTEDELSYSLTVHEFSTGICLCIYLFLSFYLLIFIYLFIHLCIYSFLLFFID